MLEWLWSNKEWLFSGVAVVVLGWFFKSKASRKQHQKLGDNSVGIQVGGDVNNHHK